MSTTAAHLATARPRAGAVAGLPGAHLAVLALRGAAWLALAASVAALVAGVLVPRLAGATPYTVTTGSMAPSLPVGTLVVVRPVAPRQVVIGDVVTYQLRSDEPLTVTHRVVGVVAGADGTRRFTTRGDANGAADPEPVRVEQVRGEVWYAVPHLGRLGGVVAPATRVLAGRPVGVGLLAWSAVLLWRWHRARAGGGGRRALR